MTTLAEENDFNADVRKAWLDARKSSGVLEEVSQPTGPLYITISDSFSSHVLLPISKLLVIAVPSAYG
jgi:hypothetical protein